MLTAEIDEEEHRIWASLRSPPMNEVFLTEEVNVPR